MEEAILPASLEALEGKLKPTQFAARIDRDAVLAVAQQLLKLTYTFPRKALPAQINVLLAQLPGGQEWFEDT
ncbi:MAG: hypothetical protein AAGF01_17270 [Cyanobacteria bacterium P01_G01_bin.38]